nr:hypothetical protein [uncultured Flavobacterium sp.]
MKIINYIIVFIFCLIISCKTKTITLEVDNKQAGYVDMGAAVYLNNHYFECSSCSKYLLVYQHLFLYKTNSNNGDYLSESDKYAGTRRGVLIDGKQSGQWISKRSFDFDSLGFVKNREYVYREEYFKNGLRDSIYKIYNKNGKIIYSTNFKNGTGLEKDFHENGKPYYEIETKDGYFVDTLKLYNAKGTLIEKLLYKKDSLVYRKVL